MRHDPMRQADIERRLSNLAKARRCGARTRAGHRCRQAAVTGRARCRMHGGARGSGGPRGDRNGMGPGPARAWTCTGPFEPRFGRSGACFERSVPGDRECGRIGLKWRIPNAHRGVMRGLRGRPWPPFRRRGRGAFLQRALHDGDGALCRLPLRGARDLRRG
jgi:hypothetical protein